MKSALIQPSGRDGLAHARMTRSKQVSIRTSYRAALRRNDLLTRNCSSGRIPRGLGDHHPSTPGNPVISIGNKPCRYASIRVDGSRSPPALTRSSTGHSDAGGMRQRLFPTGWGLSIPLEILPPLANALLCVYG